MASVKIIGKVAVKVMPDTDDFKSDLKKKLNTIEKQLGPLKIDVIPTISDAHKKKVAADVNALQKRLSGKEIEFDLGISKAEMARAEAALAALARDRQAKIKVVLEDKNVKKVTQSLLSLGGARPHIDALKKALDGLMNLDYIALNAAKVATQVLLIGGAATAATGQVFSLGSALVSTSGALLALPGLLGGVVVGLGSTAVAFADFNRQVPKAAGYMQQLENAISNNFWAQAGDQIRAFIDGVFPILKRNLKETATALGTFWGALAESLGKSFDSSALDTMFTNLNESIEIFTGYTDAIANVFAVLGKAGSEYLPRLATYFGDLTQRASDFLTVAEGDGRLFGWIDTGIKNLLALKDILVATSGIFGGFAKAANDAGATGLVGLAASLDRINAVVNSPGFQKGMTEVFKASFDMMDNLSKNAGPGLKAMILNLGDVFTKVAPKMGDTMGKALGTLFEALSDPKVNEGLVTLFDGIASAIERMTPVIEPVVQMLTDMAPLIAAIIDNIAKIGSTGTGNLAPMFGDLAKAVVPVVENLGDLYSGLMDDMAPVWEQWGKNFVKLAGAIAPMISEIKKLLDVLTPVLVPVLKLIAQLVGSALVGVFDGLKLVIKGVRIVIEGVIDVFKGLWEVIAGLFTGDFSRIGDGFKQIFGGLKDIVVGLLIGVGGAIWAWLNGSLFSIFRTAGAKLLGPLLTPIKGAWGKVVAYVATWGGKIKGVLSTAWAAVRNWWDESMSGLYFLFAKPWDDMLTFLTGAWGNITKTIGDGLLLAKAYVQSGLSTIFAPFKAAFEYARQAVSLGWAYIREAFITSWSAIRNWFDESISGLYFLFSKPWDRMVDFLIGVWARISSTIKTAFNAVKGFFDEKLIYMRIRWDEVWGAISKVASTVWGKITGFVSSGMNKVKSWVRDGINAVKGFFSSGWDGMVAKTKTAWTNVYNTIKDKFSAIKKKVSEIPGVVKGAVAGAITWLYQAGRDIIQGLIDGLDNMKDAILRKIGDISSSVISKAKSVFDINSPSKVFRGIGLGITEGLVDGIDKGYKSVLSTVSNLGSAMIGEMDGVTLGVGVTANSSAASGIASRVNKAGVVPPAATAPSGGVSIDNITIPLEDLAQLKTLEDFVNMLRVRTRMGVTG